MFYKHCVDNTFDKGDESANDFFDTTSEWQKIIDNRIISSTDFKNMVMLKLKKDNYNSETKNQRRRKSYDGKSINIV